MLITVQKQVEETLEFQTPCYYKTISGYQHVNEKGQIITVYTRMISIWEPSEGKHYVNDIQSMLQHGKPCTKEEFEKAYTETIMSFQKAASVVL